MCPFLCPEMWAGLGRSYIGSSRGCRGLKGRQRKAHRVQTIQSSPPPPPTSPPVVSYLLQHYSGDLDQIEDNIHWVYFAKTQFQKTHCSQCPLERMNFGLPWTYIIYYLCWKLSFLEWFCQYLHILYSHTPSDQSKHSCLDWCIFLPSQHMVLNIAHAVSAITISTLSLSCWKNY